MSWVSDACEALARGGSIVVRPRGGSMRGKIEDGAAVGDGNALGRHNSGLRRVDVGIGMMPQPGCAGRGDRPLKHAGPGNVQRLRAPHAIRAAADEGYEAYRRLIEDPEFPAYFTRATPVSTT